MLTQITNYDNGSIKYTVSTVFGQLDGWLQEGETQEVAVARIEQSLQDAATANQTDVVSPQVVSVQTFDTTTVPTAETPA